MPLFAAVLALFCGQAHALSLQQAVRDALENSPLPRISRAKEAASQARVSEATGAMLPHVEATASYENFGQTLMNDQYGIILRPRDRFSWQLEARQPIFSGGTLSARRDEKKALSGAAAESKRATDEDVAWDTAQTYFAALKSGSTERFQRERLQASAARKAAAKAKLAEGAGTDRELLSASADEKDASAAASAAKKKKEDARDHLSRLTGESAVGTLEPPTEIALPSPGGPPALVKIEDKNIEAAKRARDAVKGAFLPELSFVGGVRGNIESPHSLYYNEREVYGGLKLRWSLFEGGADKARLREADAKLDEAKARKRDMEEGLNEEARSAARAIDSDRRRLDDARASLDSEREAYRTVEQKYQAGRAAELAFKEAKERLAQAESEADLARYDLELSKLSLARAQGRLIEALTGSRG
jgi:adhesin transport system outer membrane protein